MKKTEPKKIEQPTLRACSCGSSNVGLVVVCPRPYVIPGFAVECDKCGARGEYRYVDVFVNVNGRLVKRITNEAIEKAKQEAIDKWNEKGKEND